MLPLCHYSCEFAPVYYRPQNRHSCSRPFLTSEWSENNTPTLSPTPFLLPHLQWGLFGPINSIVFKEGNSNIGRAHEFSCDSSPQPEHVSTTGTSFSVAINRWRHCAATINKKRKGKKLESCAIAFVFEASPMCPNAFRTLCWSYALSAAVPFWDLLQVQWLDPSSTSPVSSVGSDLLWNNKRQRRQRLFSSFGLFRLYIFGERDRGLRALSLYGIWITLRKRRWRNADNKPT